MDILRNNKVVIAVVLPVLILVIIRSFGTNHFKDDAKKWAEPSVTQINLISVNQLEAIPGQKLIIDLGKENCGITSMIKNEINVPPDSIISKSVLSMIKNNHDPVLLYSKDIRVSAKVWMMLSQLGYKNILILTNETDNEVLKYQFHPEPSINTDSLR